MKEKSPPLNLGFLSVSSAGSRNCGRGWGRGGTVRGGRRSGGSRLGCGLGLVRRRLGSRRSRRKQRSTSFGRLFEVRRRLETTLDAFPGEIQRFAARDAEHDG